MNKKLIVFCLLMMTVVFSGCPDDNKLENEIAFSLKKENRSYQRFYENRNERGEKVVNLLKDWNKSLGELNGKLLAILTLTKQDPDFKLSSLNRYSDLKATLDAIYLRPQVISVPNVPAWARKDAFQTFLILKATLRSLRENYIAVFRKDPQPYDNLMLLDFQTDEKIFDTQESCVKIMDAFSQEVIAAHNDFTCGGIALDYCGHQTDLGCVQEVLKANHFASCGMLIEVPIDADNPNISGTLTKQVRASWLNKLKPCFQSKQLLVK